MSSHAREVSQHSPSTHGLSIPSISKKILIDVGNDEEYGDEDFTDVKYELLARGHHLVSYST